MTTERYVTPPEAADAIRKITSRWKDCTKVAKLAKKSSSPLAAQAPAMVAGLVEEILQAAMFVAQGDERPSWTAGWPSSETSRPQDWRLRRSRRQSEAR